MVDTAVSTFFILRDGIMNFLDIAIIAGLTLFVYFGAKKGGARELSGVMGWVVALLVAARGAGFLAALLSKKVTSLTGTVALIVSFVVILLAVRTLFVMPAKFFEKSDTTKINQVDRFIGAVIGFVKGAFVISVLILLFHMIPFNETVKRYQSNSVLFTHMHSFSVGVVNLVFDYVPQIQSPLENTLDQLDKPEEPEI